jgi:predicted nucleic acid-binding protein
MHKTIISDTSCFIILSKIGELDILFKTYKKVTTTLEVATEFGETLPPWVEIESPKDRSKQLILELQLDRGEASAIALALEIPDSTIILDDYKARRIAEKLGLEITGTFGVIIKAKKMGVIALVKPYLEKLKTTDFRLSPELEKEVLRLAEE